MKVFLCTLLLVAASLLQVLSVEAKQSQFNKYRLADAYQFKYQWQGHQSEQQQLSFMIKHNQFDKLPPSAPAYNPLLAQNSAQRALLLYAKTLDPREARVSISQSGSTLNMKVTGTSEELVTKVNNMLSEKHKEAQSAYLEENYYIPFRDEMGREAIKHDHKRYALESAEHLKPVIEAIKEQLQNPNNTREFINFTLSWLQAIPYDTLENRVSSNGSGFASPQTLLLNNRGDCDSKSTLFLALLRAYNPRLQSTMIYLPNHALVGVRIKASKNDKTFMQNKDTFVLAEPTGPAQYQLGEIAPESQLAIRNRQVTLELF